MVLTLSAETTESKFELGRGRTVVHVQYGRGFGSMNENVCLPIQDRFSKGIENEVKDVRTFLANS